MKYNYTGVPTGFSLPPEKEGDPPIDVLLTPNGVVDLPPDFPYVQRLVESGNLTPVEESKPTKKSSKTQEEG